MVVVNFVDDKAMGAFPDDQLREVMGLCYDAWFPLVGEWFELRSTLCLCYVERSLNEGSVVLAPTPGTQPRAFPESSGAAQNLLGGVFTTNAAGDVFVDIDSYN